MDIGLTCPLAISLLYSRKMPVAAERQEIARRKKADTEATHDQFLLSPSQKNCSPPSLRGRTKTSVSWRWATFWI